MPRLAILLLLIFIMQLVSCSSSLEARLHNAASEGDTDKVNTLIAQGAKINDKKAGCLTPLMEAVMGNHPQTVSVLLKSGADDSLRDCNGNTTLIYASQYHLSEIINLILRKGEPPYEKPSSLPTPTPKLSVPKDELNEQLHDLASRMNYSDDTAIVDKDTDASIATALIKAGANINARDSNMATPLMYAAKWGHIKVMKVLIDNGADVNLQDDNGATALIWAAEAPDEKAVKFLLEHHARPNIKDNYGETALSNIQIQSDQEYQPVKRLLKKAGAK